MAINREIIFGFVGLFVFAFHCCYSMIDQRKNCPENNDKTQLDPEIEIIGCQNRNALLIGIKFLHLFEMNEKKFKLKKFSTK